SGRVHKKPRHRLVRRVAHSSPSFARVGGVPKSVKSRPNCELTYARNAQGCGGGAPGLASSAPSDFTLTTISTLSSMFGPPAEYFATSCSTLATISCDDLAR